MMPPSRLIAPPRIACSWQRKICLRSPTGSKDISTNRWASVARALLPAKRRRATRWFPPALSAGCSPLFLLLVGYQLAAGSITFLRHFQKCHHDHFAARPGFFHHCVGNALGDLAFLIGRAALEHGDLN